jgi:VWFA-related protein
MLAVAIAALAATSEPDRTQSAQNSSLTLPPPAQPASNQPEIVTRQEPATFRTRLNLVSVPVVVRDSKGHAVGGLTRDDFQLFDHGKLQIVTQFSVQKSGEKSTAQTGADTPAVTPKPPILEEGAPATADMPQRFIAYLFDDQHLPMDELTRARDAAIRHLSTLQPTDRAAVYTISGQNQLEFTDEHEKLQQALLSIRPRSIADPPGTRACPDISLYQADLIYNKHDPIAINSTIQDTAACMGMPPSAVVGIVQGASQHVLSVGSQENNTSFMALRVVVRRMSSMPGQRTVILVSPGFLTLSDFETARADIVESAVRANVLINSLDARGLWTDPSLDPSRQNHASSAAMLTLKTQYDRATATSQSTMLADLAFGTGGSLFENSNDLDEGLHRLATMPEYIYVLSFSPQNLKLDGAFHALKVSIKNPPGLSLQARRGYYAPSKPSDPAEAAKQEIEEAFTSRDEMSELPVELRTTFFEVNAKEAKLTVRCRIDPKHVPFKKVDGRSHDTLTIVSGIFDRDGEYVSGMQRIVELNLSEETLNRLINSGVAVNTDYTVAPGTYVVRLIVRDSEGQLMSAVNGTVAIP